MKNEYEVRGDVTAIIINSPKYGRQEALISTSKLERVKELPNSWRINFSKNVRSFYVIGHTRENGRRNGFSLHRWITEAQTGMVVDHINHDTLDNTDSNLRVITHAENKQNLKGAPVNSKSGIRGVSWHKSVNKWRVQIKINQVNKHIGSFDNLEDAKHAAIEARMHHMPYSQEAPL